MPEPILIPLTPHQKVLLAELKREQDQITARRNDVVAAIIGQTHDPASLQTWRIQLATDAILCTPPAEQPT